jgi:sugar transferase (PEP-CTERM/EpsH1 system associated)
MAEAKTRDTSRPDVLFLCHRIPFPPDKGDKIRSYRWLKALSSRFRVHLATFVDDPRDWPHTRTVLAECTSALFRPLDRRRATLRSLTGLLDGRPLTLPFYADREMRRWVDERVRRHAISRVLVYSSAMAQYAGHAGLRGARRVMDLVDVDSEKWRQYAAAKPWPLSWLYRREADRLADYEVRIAREVDRTLLVSTQETALLSGRASDLSGRLEAVRNGVDTEYFAPSTARVSPFDPGQPTVVFTGAMDYWANVDGVGWFAREVWPLIRAARPDARFVVVGSNPGSEVQALAGADIRVTGRVPDVRPYLQHAAVVVAPLRIARGIQNKVLEGMAMGRPVVVTSDGLAGIDAVPGDQVLVADDPRSFAATVLGVLSGSHADLGGRARRFVVDGFSWEEVCERVLELLEPGSRSAPLAPISRMVAGAGIPAARAAGQGGV